MAEHVLRIRPVVACSRSYDANDPDPADAIDRFDREHDPWIVAVNMISEGVDIRRLVYLTNRMTLLSFRQIVGRVVRSDPANVDDQGRVYLPADRRLLEMAREITNEVDLLPPPMIIETDPPRERRVSMRDGTGIERVEFEVLRTSGEQGGIFDTSGNLADASLVNRARRFICVHKLTGTDAESLALLARQRPALQVSGEQTLPTIVLIGGQLTLADGSQVDSRQAAADEKTARALEAAVTSRAEWWSAVSSIVVPTLDDCEGGFAVIFGQRSIIRTALDGETRRSGLGKVASGCCRFSVGDAIGH